MKIVRFVNNYELVSKITSFVMIFLLTSSILSYIDLNKLDYRISLLLGLPLISTFILVLTAFPGSAFSKEQMIKMISGIKLWTVAVLICNICIIWFSNNSIQSNVYNEKNKPLIQIIAGGFDFLIFAFNIFAISQLFLIKNNVPSIEQGIFLSRYAGLNLKELL